MSVNMYFGIYLNYQNNSVFQDVVDDLTEKINFDPRMKVPIHIDEFLNYLNELKINLGFSIDLEISEPIFHKFIFLPYILEAREIASTLTHNYFILDIDSSTKLPSDIYGNVVEYKLALGAHWELPVPQDFLGLDIVLNRGFHGIVGFDSAGLTPILVRLPSDTDINDHQNMIDEFPWTYQCDRLLPIDYLQFRHGILYKLTWKDLSVATDGDRGGRGAGDFTFHNDIRFNVGYNGIGELSDKCKIFPLGSIGWFCCVQKEFSQENMFGGYSWNTSWFEKNEMQINEVDLNHWTGYVFNSYFPYRNENKNISYIAVFLPQDGNTIDIEIELKIREHDDWGSYTDIQIINFQPSLPFNSNQSDPNYLETIFPIQGTLYFYNGDEPYPDLEWAMDVNYQIECMEYWYDGKRMDNGIGDGKCSIDDFSEYENFYGLLGDAFNAIVDKIIVSISSSQ